MAIKETLTYTFNSVVVFGIWQYVTLALLLSLVFMMIHLRYSLGDFDVPTIGVQPGILGPWIAPYSWLKNSSSLVQEGRDKYGIHGLPFKVRSPSRWMVFVNNTTIVDEIIRLPETIVSSRAALDELFASHFAMYKGIFAESSHVDVIKKHLSGRCSELIPAIMDEVKISWDEKTNIGKDWTKIRIWDVLIQVAARTVSRSILGVPLCRDEHLLHNITVWAENVVAHSEILELVPVLLRPLINRIFFYRNKQQEIIMSYFAPIFERRKQEMEISPSYWTKEHGSNPKPNDGFQWVLDTAPPGLSTEHMVIKLLFIFTAAIHTTAVTSTHCFLDLATMPQYQAPVREEIKKELHEASREKQMKEAWAKMWKLDSVLRESGRINGTHLGTVMRKVLVPYTFSDGMSVPKGCWVVGASSTIHRSAAYEDPDIYDGYRFSRMREAPGMGTRFQLTSTSTEYLAWGGGAFACPGRFYAGIVLRIIFAHVLSGCEFKLEDGTKERPGNIHFAIARLPDMGACLMFRRLQSNSEGEGVVIKKSV